MPSANADASTFVATDGPTPLRCVPQREGRPEPNSQYLQRPEVFQQRYRRLKARPDLHWCVTAVLQSPEGSHLLQRRDHLRESARLDPAAPDWPLRALPYE